MPIEEGDNRGIDPRQKAYEDSLALYNNAKELWDTYTYTGDELMDKELKGRLSKVNLIDLNYDKLATLPALGTHIGDINFEKYKKPDHNPDSGNMLWFDNENISPINELNFLYGNWESGNTNKFRFPLYKKPTKPDRSIGRLPLLKLESDLPKTELIKQTFPKKDSSNLRDAFNVEERQQAVIEKGTGKFLRYEMVPYATKWRGEKYEMIEDAEPISRYETATERQERLGKVATPKLDNGGAPKYPNGGESKKTKDFSEVKVTADDESEFAPGILELPEMQAIAPLYHEDWVRDPNWKSGDPGNTGRTVINFDKGIIESSADRYLEKYSGILEGSKSLFEQAQALVNTPGGRYLKSIGTSEIVENPELVDSNRVQKLQNYIYNAQAYNNKLNEYDEAVESMNTIDPKTGKPELSRTKFERLYKRKNWDQVDPNVRKLTPEQQEEAKSEWYGKNYIQGNTWVDNIKDIQSAVGNVDNQIINFGKTWLEGIKESSEPIYDPKNNKLLGVNIDNIERYLNRKIRGVYDPSLNIGTGLSYKDTVFNLGDYNLKYDRDSDNFYPEGGVLFGGDFIGSGNQLIPQKRSFVADNPENEETFGKTITYDNFERFDPSGIRYFEPSVRTAEQWLGADPNSFYGDFQNVFNLTTAKRDEEGNRLPGQRSGRRTVGDIINYYGIEDGKFKLGPAEDFKSETLIVPNRFDDGRTIASAKIDTFYNKGVPSYEAFRMFDSKGNPIYHNTGGRRLTGYGSGPDESGYINTGLGKIILYSKDTGKSIAIAGSKEKLNEETNKFLENNTNVVPVVLDRGRFSPYSIGTGEGGKLTKDDIETYYDLDIGRRYNIDPGYNIILDKKQDGGEILDNGGEPEKTKYLPEVTARAYDTARELVQSGKMDTNVFDNLYRRYNWAKYDRKNVTNEYYDQGELERDWYGGYNPVDIANQVPYWLGAAAAGPSAIWAATPAVSAALANPFVQAGLTAYGLDDATKNTIPSAYRALQEGRYWAAAGNTALTGLNVAPGIAYGKNIINTFSPAKNIPQFRFRSPVDIPTPTTPTSLTTPTKSGMLTSPSTRSTGYIYNIDHQRKVPFTKSPFSSNQTTLGQQYRVSITEPIPKSKLSFKSLNENGKIWDLKNKDGNVSTEKALKIITNDERASSFKVERIKEEMLERYGNIPEKINFNELNDVVNSTITPFNIQVNTDGNPTYGYESIGYDDHLVHAKYDELFTTEPFYRKVQDQTSQLIKERNKLSKKFKHTGKQRSEGKGDMAYRDPETQRLGDFQESNDIMHSRFLEKIFQIEKKLENINKDFDEFKNQQIALEEYKTKKGQYLLNQTDVDKNYSINPIQLVFSNKEQFPEFGIHAHGSGPNALGRVYGLTRSNTPDTFTVTQAQDEFSQLERGRQQTSIENLNKKLAEVELKEVRRQAQNELISIFNKKGNYNQATDTKYNDYLNYIQYNLNKASWESSQKPIEAGGLLLQNFKNYGFSNPRPPIQTIIKEVENVLGRSLFSKTGPGSKEYNLEKAKIQQSIKAAPEARLYQKNSYNRMIQETIDYAAKNNFKKVRFPTGDTANKIQRYGRHHESRKDWNYENIGKLPEPGKNVKNLGALIHNNMDINKTHGIVSKNLNLDEKMQLLGSITERLSKEGIRPKGITVDEIEEIAKSEEPLWEYVKEEVSTNKGIKKIKKFKSKYFTEKEVEEIKALNNEGKRITNYLKEYKDTPTGKGEDDAWKLIDRARFKILDRYDNIDKLLKKYYPGAKIEKVSDEYENTWWEIFIPENVLKGEKAIIPYKDGGEVTDLTKGTSNIKSILDKYFTPQELENGGDVFSKPQQSDNIDTNQKGTSHITGWIEDRTPFSMPNTSEDTDMEMVFRDKYNTELTPSEEVRFKIWMDTYENALGNKMNPMDFGAYDVKGYWKSGDWEKADERGHGSDTWKKPNHPTFSEESIYSSQKGGSEYEGGTWMDDGAFIPGYHNMHSNDRLDWEFSRDEGPEYLLRGEYILPEVTVTGNTAIQGEAE